VLEAEGGASGPVPVGAGPPTRPAAGTNGSRGTTPCYIGFQDPELGRGLDIAREYGVADLDEDDEWVVGPSLSQHASE
jgi:hypothetical protein